METGGVHRANRDAWRYAFPPFATSPVPWLLAGNLRYGIERRPQPEIAQDGAALHERQRHQVASIQPEDVEHVISDVRTAPIDLAIQDDLIHKQCADHVGDGRIMLRQLIAGE